MAATALQRNIPVTARSPQISQQHFLNHLRWRFAPTLIFVCAHSLRPSAINDAVFAIEMRRHQRPQRQRNARRVRLSVWFLCRHRQLIILHRMGPTASCCHSPKRQRQHPTRRFYIVPTKNISTVPVCVAAIRTQSSGLHCRSPVLCSRGLLARNKVYGLFLIVFVNSFRFSLASRKFPSISSILSEFTSSV